MPWSCLVVAMPQGGSRDSPAKPFKTQEEDTGSVWADLDQWEEAWTFPPSHG